MEMSAQDSNEIRMNFVLQKVELIRDLNLTISEAAKSDLITVRMLPKL